MTNKEKLKNFFEKIKKMIKEHNTFNEIKRNIFISKDEIIIKNINMPQSLCKCRLNNYLLFLIDKYPMHKLIFNYCDIDDINISINKSILFQNCTINNLKIDEKNICGSKFVDCNFNFNKNSQKIFIYTSKVEMENCVTTINNNKNCCFAIGLDRNSNVSIKKHIYVNEYSKYFKLFINSRNLILNNYNSPNCIELLINDYSKKIDSIYITNSTAVFSSNNVIETRMMLIENADVKNLTTESESIELSGNNGFNNVQILKCNDITINYESGLTTKNSVINTKLLECSENSEINDTTNRLKWLSNIGKINTFRGFKLKYEGKTIYEKTITNSTKNDAEQIIDNVKKYGKVR